MNDTQRTMDREMLAFLIGTQEFCVDVMAVREIRGWTAATPLPHSPGYVRGVVNLRGAVLPVIDLARRLGLDSNDPTARHVIIVSEIGARVVGVLVDAVSGILNVSADMVQPTPAVAFSDEGGIEGIIAIDGRMVGLLSLDSIVPGAALEAMAA